MHGNRAGEAVVRSKAPVWQWSIAPSARARSNGDEAWALTKDNQTGRAAGTHPPLYCSIGFTRHGVDPKHPQAEVSSPNQGSSAYGVKHRHPREDG